MLFLLIALVDPDRIYIPLCDDPDELARGEEFGKLLINIQCGLEIPVSK